MSIISVVFHGTSADGFQSVLLVVWTCTTVRKVTVLEIPFSHSKYLLWVVFESKLLLSMITEDNVSILAN